MNSHLSPEEFVDALDGVLPVPRRDHLDRCDACRQEVASLGSLARHVDAASHVPEPSPLYWDHLSRRIGEATATESAAASGWWRMAWRPVLAGGAMVAAAMVVVMMRAPAGPVSPPGPVVVPVPIETTSAGARAEAAGDSADEGDPAWEVVVAMAGGLSREAVHNMLPAGPDTAVLTETMTDRERQEFVKLLKQQMGGFE